MKNLALKMNEPHMMPRLICFKATRMRAAWVATFYPTLAMQRDPEPLKPKMSYGRDESMLMELVEVCTTFACMQYLAGFSGFLRGENDNQRVI